MSRSEESSRRKYLSKFGIIPLNPKIEERAKYVCSLRKIEEQVKRTHSALPSVNKSLNNPKSHDSTWIPYLKRKKY
ncbi:MAG: hypothetical protein AAGA18_16070 [Verrucomicrobiota bacterium]